MSVCLRRALPTGLFAFTSVPTLLVRPPRAPPSSHEPTALRLLRHARVMLTAPTRPKSDFRTDRVRPPRAASRLVRT
eukprot:5901999-Pyramimonas_sp.AAC.1